MSAEHSDCSPSHQPEQSLAEGTQPSDVDHARGILEGNLAFLARGETGKLRATLAGVLASRLARLVSVYEPVVLEIAARRDLLDRADRRWEALNEIVIAENHTDLQEEHEGIRLVLAQQRAEVSSIDRDAASAVSEEVRSLNVWLHQHITKLSELLVSQPFPPERQAALEEEIEHELYTILFPLDGAGTLEERLERCRAVAEALEGLRNGLLPDTIPPDTTPSPEETLGDIDLSQGEGEIQL